MPHVIIFFVLGKKLRNFSTHGTMVVGHIGKLNKPPAGSVDLTLETVLVSYF